MLNQYIMCARKNSNLIMDKLRETIFSEEIILKYKNNPIDFTRNRKQPFGQMLVFMLNLLTHVTQKSTKFS
jgi:hypothetical protein